MKYAFIEAQRTSYAVVLLCRLLEVTEQGVYAWRKRPVSQRRIANQLLGDRIQMIHAESRQRYGSPRVYRELNVRLRTPKKTINSAVCICMLQSFMD